MRPFYYFCHFGGRLRGTMRIYLIRHARQSTTLCNLDVNLAEEGIEQAHLLGKRIAKYQPDAVYSSDLLRAVETANIVSSYLENIPHFIKQELREIDFGDLTGHTDEYNETHYGDFLSKRKAMIEDLAFPGGENGQQVYDRAIKVIKEITKQNYERVAIVTHGGTIRSLVAGLLKMHQADKLLFAVSLENSSITEVIYEEELERFYLERFNDYSHLEVKPELLRNYWK